MKNLRNLCKKLIVILAVFIMLFSSSFTTIYAVEDIIEEVISEDTEDEIAVVSEEETEELPEIVYTPNEDYTEIEVVISMETKVITKIEIAIEEYDSELAEEDYTFLIDTDNWTFSQDSLQISQIFTENTNDCILLTFEDETTELINVCVSGLSSDKVYDEAEEDTDDEEVVDETGIATVSVDETEETSSSEDDGIASVSEDDIATVLTSTESTNYTTITDTTLLDGDYDDVEINITSLPTIQNINDPNSRVKSYGNTVNSNRDDLPITAIWFNWTTTPELDTDLSFDVYFSSCGTLNGTTIDMKLTYKNICFYGTNYMNIVWENYDISYLYFYWTAYGTTSNQTSNNEWFYAGIESFECRIYFYDHDTGSQIKINDIFITTFSLDSHEGIGGRNETTNYIYSSTGLTFYSYWESFSGMAYGDGDFVNVKGLTNNGKENYDAGSFLGCSFEFTNVNYISLRGLYYSQSSTASGNIPYVRLSLYVYYSSR